MTDQEKISELIILLEEIKQQLDTECCQTLMDADSVSVKIEKKLIKIQSH